MFAYTHLQIQLTLDTGSKKTAPAQLGERAEFMPSVGLKMKAGRQEPKEAAKTSTSPLYKNHSSSAAVPLPLPC